MNAYVIEINLKHLCFKISEEKWSVLWNKITFANEVNYMYEDIYLNLYIWGPYTANQRHRMLKLKVILGGL